MDAPFYIQLTLSMDPIMPAREIAVAWLETCGFDMFEESSSGLLAYGKESNIDEEAKNQILDELSKLTDLKVDVERVASKNWNAVWESDYEPIDVDGMAMMRAPFHSPPSKGLDLIIQPQMSFGTGHHPTTWQMLRRVLDLEVKGKHVLDMGCGTGVLAIACHLLEAAEVVAIDIDVWSYENTQANYRLNGLDPLTSSGEILHGESDLLKSYEKKFDLVLANINRNVLLADMVQYDASMHPGSKVLMSGFFPSDFDQLNAKALDLGWNWHSSMDRDGWACILWEKIGN